MRRPLALAAGMALALFCCNNGDGEPDMGAPKDKGPDSCWRPATITSCLMPPNSCTDKVLCLNCTCTGALKVFACDGFTQDCRWFCTGCYPLSYTLCTKEAPKNILGLCGYCSSDAGKGKCDKIRGRDAGQ